MKPPAGITKLSSQTQSSLGAIIETTVDFQSGSNKIDPVYNTTIDCPKCKGEKYIWV